MSEERDLLVGALAVQLGVATLEQVRAAATMPAAEGAELAARLEAAGVLDPARRRMIDEMVTAALAAHGGDAQRSLQTFGGAAAALESLGGTLRVRTTEEEPSPPTAESITAVTGEHPGRYTYRGSDPSGGPARRDAAELGRGGIGRVLVAFDEHLGRQVALKELLPARGQAQQALSTVIVRFLREARVTGQLEHPNIVPVYELGRHPDGALYYTMRFVRGRTLATRLAQANGLAERLRLLGVFWDMCNALAFAHSRGVVHRDVKPANVMVGEFGETVVLDWGLAKVRGKEDLRSGELAKGLSLLRELEAGKTAAGEVLGTPLYMSPEQAGGELDEIDERSDVWGLGAVLYEILTGRPPFTGDTVGDVLGKVLRAPLTKARTVCPEVPPELAAIAEKALQRDKARRYQNARELAEEMEAYLTGGRVRAHVYSSLELLRRFASRNRVALAVSAVALALLLALGVFSYLRVVAERNRAVAAEQTERIRRAEAQREGANTALLREDLLEARAKLRGSLEALDSAPGRALWWSLSRDPLVWKRELPVPVYDVAYTPDGRTIALACADHSIYLFDAQTRALKRVLRGNRDAVLTLAISPAGDRLASGSWGGETWLWDLATGIGRPLPGKAGGVIWALAFSPDGRLLASTGEGKQVAIWSVGPQGQEPRPVQALVGHEEAVTSLAFHPDGAGLASASFDKSIRWWTRDAAEGGFRLQRTLTGHTATVQCVAVSPDGELLASASRDKTALLWDIARGEPVQVLAGHPQLVMGVRFSPDGAHVATGANDGVLRVWRVAPTTPPRATAAEIQLTGHTDGARRVAWSPDGRHLASASLDKSLRVWDWRREQATRVAVGHTEGVIGLAWSPDGKTLASGGRDKSILVWDAGSGEQLRVLTGHTAPVNCVGFSPDGTTLAAGGDEAGLWLWDLATGSRAQAPSGSENALSMASYSHDGSLLAAGGTDGLTRVWAVGADKGLALRHTLAGHTGMVMDLCWSPDDRTLATSSRDKTIRLWDVTTGKQLRVLAGHADQVIGIAWSPDGQRLASGSFDQTVRLWDVATGAGRVLGEHAGRVYWLAFHPDGRRVGSPSSDRTARIWDTTPGAEGRFVTLAGHQGEVNFLRFSPDGSLAATSGDDGTVRLWDASTGRPIWRAPALLASHELLTHQGWSRPGLGAFTPQAREWRRALAERGRLSADRGGRLCLATFTDELELWDMAADRRLHVAAAPGIERLLAAPDGCLSLAGGKARLVTAAGAERELVPAGASAIAWDNRGPTLRILVAAERQVVSFSAAGERIASFPADPGITALATDRDWIILGYEEGNVELVSRSSGQRRPGFSLEATPGSPVEGLLPGEMGTLVVGYGDGLLGLWSLESGRRLAAAHLHGPVRHLQLDGRRLLAATELGGALAWDLRVFSAGYCDILRQVWAAVPVVWEAGQAVRQDPPADHPCRVEQDAPPTP